MAGRRKSEVEKLAAELQAAGVKPQDIRKMIAASKTAPETSRLTKARAGLRRAKAAKARFEASPEGLLGRASRAASKRKAKKKKR